MEDNKNIDWKWLIFFILPFLAFGVLLFDFKNETVDLVSTLIGVLLFLLFVFAVIALSIKGFMKKGWKGIFYPRYLWYAPLSNLLARTVTSRVSDIGKTEKEGKTILFWEITEADWFWRQFKASIAFKLTAISVLLIFALWSFIHLLNNGGLTIFQILIGVLFSTTALALIFTVTFWILSKLSFTLRPFYYELTNVGIYMTFGIPGYKFTGTFTPFSLLEYPKFDDRNQIIFLKLRREFLRKFKLNRSIICRKEDYEQVKNYIKGVYGIQ